MEVSRRDILSTDIDDTRGFLKLPVKPYLELLSMEPVPSQIAIINAINNPKYRFVTAAISRRQGKTYIANIIGQLVSLVPGCNILIMSPNYSLSQISFDLQRKLIKHFDLEVVKDNAKDKVIELSNGSTIRMGSVNQVDSTVGRSYDLIIFDEAALSSGGEEAFNVALRPTLDKDESKALFISTPRGRNNWFSTFFQRGFSDEYPQWASVHATWHDNPRTSIADIEEAKLGMSENEFNQEYLADFNVYEGQIWQFNHETCIQDLSSLDVSNMEIFAGLDIGFKDATALCVLAWDGATKYYCLDEYYATERTTSSHAAYLKELIDKWNIDLIFIDSAAQQTRFDLASDYDISTNNAKKSLLDGIGYVASIIEQDNLIIDMRCTETLRSIDQYQWDPNENLMREKPKNNSARHLADALRYALYSYETNSYTF